MSKYKVTLINYDVYATVIFDIEALSLEDAWLMAESLAKPLNLNIKEVHIDYVRN